MRASKLLILCMALSIAAYSHTIEGSLHPQHDIGSIGLHVLLERKDTKARVALLGAYHHDQELRINQKEHLCRLLQLFPEDPIFVELLMMDTTQGAHYKKRLLEESYKVLSPEHFARTDNIDGRTEQDVDCIFKGHSWPHKKIMSHFRHLMQRVDDNCAAIIRDSSVPTTIKEAVRQCVSENKKKAREKIELIIYGKEQWHALTESQKMCITQIGFRELASTLLDMNAIRKILAATTSSDKTPIGIFGAWHVYKVARILNNSGVFSALQPEETIARITASFSDELADREYGTQETWNTITRNFLDKRPLSVTEFGHTLVRRFVHDKAHQQAIADAAHADVD